MSGILAEMHGPKQRGWSFALALSTLTFLASCTTQDSGSCLTARDCPVDHQCVGSMCEPVAGGTDGTCVTSDDCGLGEFCDTNTGMCEAFTTTACTEDSQCPPTQRCQVSHGLCVDGARSCIDSRQCASIGYHCNSSGQCVQCLNNNHCPGTSTCRNGACESMSSMPPGRSCTEDADCGPPGLVCQTNQCVPGCAVSGSPVVCGAGTICDASTGRCRSTPNACATDAECGPPRRICENMQCIAGCVEPGGLMCTGGNVCNRNSGRCEPPSGCTTDAECGAPLQVCDNSMCVPGCGQPGATPCGIGSVCDTTTGRCVAVPNRCTNDAECNPPSTVCEAGQCIGGCGVAGGLQCQGNEICNATTGRCDPGMTPMCTMDSQCNPPSTVCDTTTGLCAPGCLTTGCPTGQTCNNQTGRCQMGGPMGGNNLNSTCTVNSDCDSRVCFDLGQSFGRRCVQSCGAGAQCPNGYTCYDFNGGRMCLSTQLFSNATFSTPAGGVCTEGGQCKSNFCPAPTAGARMCVETCTEDTDCSGGRCRWYEAVPDRWIGACSGPQGAVPDGSPCTLDTQCASGACINSVCSKLCSSTADCANGQSCAPAEYHECVLPGLSCLLWQANLTTVCVSGPHGSDPVGATCTTFSNCRSGLCHTGINQCTDVCATDADCPSTHRCKILPLRTLTDGTTVNVNVCMPASF